MRKNLKFSIKTYNKNDKFHENKLKLSDLERFFEGFEQKKIKEKPLILKEILVEREVIF